ncbi:MAG: phage tail protein [Acidobacteria bacterium]|nr:phage tail protein [Acidobacteriota bacterium]MBV9476745.1 phage tail protein [Acidobacteriota bacterium]
MYDAFIGEIRMFAGNYAPEGWAFCDGAELSIGEQPVLFRLIQTKYGGDGHSTFRLPDLRGRAPVHAGNGYALGQKGGSETVTLTLAELPIHIHGFNASTAVATDSTPENKLFGEAASMSIYAATANAPVPNALDAAGGGQPHENMQPFQVVNYIICMQGYYPQG